MTMNMPRALMGALALAAVALLAREAPELWRYAKFEGM